MEYNYDATLGASATNIQGDIKKSINAEWVNVIETVTLMARGLDVDYRCNKAGGEWEAMEDNFWDKTSTGTAWSGTGVQGSTGREVTWTVATHTAATGVTVTATLKDKNGDPHADAEDDDVTVTRTLKAFEVTVWFKPTGKTDTVVRQSAASGASQAFTLTHAKVESTGRAGVKAMTEKSGHVEWSLGVLPDGATLGTNGKICDAISVTTVGTIEAKAFGDDGSAPYPTVTATGPTVTAASPYGGVSFGTISFSREAGDYTAGAGTIAYGFSSDLLGAVGSDQAKTAKAATAKWLLGESQSTNMNHTASADYKGDLNTQPVFAKGAVYGKCTDFSTFGRGSIECKNATITFTAAVPTYYWPQGMSPPGPEDGYNDDYTP